MTSRKKKFELDVEYVDMLSFSMDFRIFWLTILKILQREGITNPLSGPWSRLMGGIEGGVSRILED